MADSQQYTIKDFLEIKYSHTPTINHDGSLIAYLNNDTGTNQLYLYEKSTQTTTQITSYEDYIESATFSPVNNQIVFVKSEGGNEKGQLYLFDVATKKITPLTDKPEIKFGFGGFSHDGKKIVYSSNERNGTDFDILIMDLDNKTSGVIFSEGGWCSGHGFSPKDNYVVVSKFDSNVNNDLYLIDLKTKQSRQITNHKEETNYGKPQWLPDESGFYVRTNLEKEFLGIAFYELEMNTFDFKISPNWDVEELVVSDDGTKIGYILNEDGYNNLHLVSTKDFNEIHPAPFSNGLVTTLSIDGSGNFVCFDFSSSTDPWNVYVWDLVSGKTEKISTALCPIPTDIFVEPELIRYKSFDGLEISAFLYKPKGVENPPSMINIHGGPEGQYQAAFTGINQFFVYNGYAIIAPNVRGSSGYGKKFLSLDNIEKRLDSVKDIESLVGYLNENKLVDPEKISVMGGSYGGFMVLACLCFYPQLFAAGVDVVGIANFVTFLENTSPYRRALREIEYGYLDKDRAFLESISPINHIEKITAPLLVIHGANDPRVPLNEAQQVKDKLEQLGRKVELLVYEDEGHGLGKLKNKLDAYPKVVQFLDSILK